MKKRTLFFLAGVVTLSAACSHFPMDSRAPDPTRPQVTVVSDRFIVVNQEPLIFLKDQKNVTITWHLPRDSKYRFQPRDGVDIEEKGRGEIAECAARNDGIEFSCVNRHTRPGKYSYTIRLTSSSGRLSSDPHIFNE